MTEFTQSVAGTMAGAGGMGRSVAHGVAGQLLGVVADLDFVATRTLGSGEASVVGVGGVARVVGRGLAGAMASVGGVARGIGLVVGGVVASGAVLSNQVGKGLMGAMASVGGVVRSINRVLVGVLEWFGEMQPVHTQALLPLVQSWTLRARSRGWTLEDR